MTTFLKQQKRCGVFETNSSSSHSLTLSQSQLVAAPWPASMLREGIIPLSVDVYGWEWRRYYLLQ